MTPAVRIDPPDLPDDLEPTDALTEFGLDCAHLDGARHPGLRLVAATIDASRLEDVDLSGAKLPNLGVRDSVLERCNLANADLRGASLRRSLITASRMTGLLWSDGVAEDLEVAESRIDLAAFAGARLERVRFSSCVLGQTDFQGARLKSVAFEDCDLREADLSGARFDDVELRGCRLDGLRGAANLRGVRMPWSDVLDAAGVFAAACGVKVLTDGE
jgi:uncharacterized protein YjbI with pentapeptide repeats